MVYQQEVKWISVNDMYEYARANNLALLSLFGDDFWDEYITNYSRYDALFKRKYKNFRYFDQNPYEEEMSVEKVTKEFIEEVYNHLLVNRKRYAEIVSVNQLDNTTYNIFDNVNYTETRNESENSSGTDTYGERTDNTTNTSGERVDTTEDKVSAYNSTTYENSSMTTDSKGSQTDTTGYNKGEQINTNDKSRTTEATLIRKGKVSGASAESLIKEHLELWDMYEFYDYIFSDICSELLLV